MILKCPHCHKALKAAPQLVGKRVKCPACRTEFLLAGAPPEDAAPSEQQDAGPPAAEKQEEEGGDAELRILSDLFADRASDKQETTAGHLLTGEVVQVLAGIDGDRPEHRKFADYPILTECSRAFQGSPSPEALTHFERRLRGLACQEPDFDLPYLWLGDCINRIGDYPRAVKTLLRGIERSRRKGHLCATLAEISIGQADLDIAIRAAVQAAKLGTDLYIAHHLLAQYLLMHNKHQQASEILKGVPTELEPEMAEKLQSLISRKDSDRLDRIVEELLAEQTGRNPGISHGAATAHEELSAALHMKHTVPTKVSESPPPLPGPRPQQSLGPNMQIQPPVASHRFSRFSTAGALFLHFITLGIFTTIWLNLLHGKMPKNRPNDPTAARAILFLLIPLFNVYWLFFTYWRLCTRINEQRAEAGLRPAPLRMIGVLMCATLFVPYVWVGALVLAPVFLGMIQTSVNKLVAKSDYELREFLTGKGFAEAIAHRKSQVETMVATCLGQAKAIDEGAVRQFAESGNEKASLNLIAANVDITILRIQAIDIFGRIMSERINDIISKRMRRAGQIMLDSVGQQLDVNAALQLAIALANAEMTQEWARFYGTYAVLGGALANILKGWEWTEAIDTIMAWPGELRPFLALAAFLQAYWVGNGEGAKIRPAQMASRCMSWIHASPDRWDTVKRAVEMASIHQAGLRHGKVDVAALRPQWREFAGEVAKHARMLKEREDHKQEAQAVLEHCTKI